MKKISEQVPILLLDAGSQPSRALWLFCLASGIPHRVQSVRITKGEHKSAEHMKKHPFGKVPAITVPQSDGSDFHLFESLACARYLRDRYGLGQQFWGGEDAQARARINAYLNYHQSNVRPAAAGYSFQAYLAPLRGIQVPRDSVERAAKQLAAEVDVLQNVFLADTPFLYSQHASVADIWAYQELFQVGVTDLSIFIGNPKIAAWWKRVEQAFPDLAVTNKWWTRVIRKAKDQKSKL